MVLGFGDPTKGMTRIWGHFVILVGCKLVTFKPQIMLKMTFYTIRYFKSESPGEPWVWILLPLNNFFLFFVFIFFLSIASLQIIFEFDYIFEPICSHFYIKRLSK